MSLEKESIIKAATERGLKTRKKGNGIDAFVENASDWHKVPFFRKDLNEKFPHIKYSERTISGKVHIQIKDLE